MFRFSAKSMIITGGVLLVLGVILPLLRVLDILPSVLAIDFITWAIMVSGTFIGMMGVFSYVKVSRDAHAEKTQFDFLNDDIDES